MSTIEHWISCAYCQGLGKKSQKVSKKKLFRYEATLAQLEKKGESSEIPKKPQKSMQRCTVCSGTGLIISDEAPIADIGKYPHVAIVGAGIGGIALALACLHRQIPFTIFERDRAFNDRSQGYGLTLQQASKELKKFGIQKLEEGVVSTLHLAHSSNGEIVGNWGLRNLVDKEAVALKNKNKDTNIHIARQSLRLAFLNQLGEANFIQWNHQLLDLKVNQKVELTFDVDGIHKQFDADLVVGADGIRSSVRRLLIDEEVSPLRYLGCIVILGICKLNALSNLKTELLDGKTVFQTANGTQRMYMMPFDKDSVMWQFSYPISEEEARTLSKNGSGALKNEVLKLTKNWHHPIPQILEATQPNEITGYPVYDRALLSSDLLENAGPVTILGDAAHPMSPFKGQGANQALLDALHLAQKITSVYNDRKDVDLRKDVLEPFEKEMMDRSSVKVKKSAEAAKFLHTDIVLQEGNITFGGKWSSSL